MQRRSVNSQGGKSNSASRITYIADVSNRKQVKSSSRLDFHKVPLEIEKIIYLNRPPSVKGSLPNESKQLKSRPHSGKTERKHFKPQVSESNNEMFRPSLKKTLYSARAHQRSEMTVFDSKPSLRVAPSAACISRSSGAIWQNEINQLNKEIPSMRQRGSRKQYDPSKFKGQLDYQGFWPATSYLFGGHQPSRISAAVPLRYKHSKRSDSSNVKRVVFNQDC